VVVIRSFSENPGTREELEQIILRWDLILVNRVIEILRNEAKGG
jgi:hypothetical protein